MEKKEENITVAVRIRPLQERETSSDSTISWASINEYIIKETAGTREFFFDKVYDQSVSTMQIFNELGNSVVEKCLNGYNGC